VLQRLYLIVGALVLGLYGTAGYLGLEFTNPDNARPAPPPGAIVAESSSGWSGRSASYRAYSSSSSSSSEGDGGWVIFGGK
jgi:hypothetical protein